MDEATRGRALARVDAYARTLVAHAAPITFTVATTDAEREAIWRLRAGTILRQGWAPPDAFPDGMERDDFDDRAVLIGGWDGDTLAATGRLVFPEPGLPLPTEVVFDLVAEPAGEVVNLDRIIVTPAYSDPDHRVFMGLVARCWQEQRARGYSLVLSTETVGVLRIDHRVGWHVTPLGPSRMYWGEARFPCRFDPLVGFSNSIMDQRPESTRPSRLPLLRAPEPG